MKKGAEHYGGYGGADAGIADWLPKRAATQSLVDLIRPGDRVTIVDRFGQQRSGKAVMRSSDGGWTLNMGGRHGTPGLAHEDNIVKVTPGKNRGWNPIEPGPRGGYGQDDIETIVRQRGAESGRQTAEGLPPDFADVGIPGQASGSAGTSVGASVAGWPTWDRLDDPPDGGRGKTSPRVIETVSMRQKRGADGFAKDLVSGYESVTPGDNRPNTPDSFAGNLGAGVGNAAENLQIGYHAGLGGHNIYDPNPTHTLDNLGLGLSHTVGEGVGDAARAATGAAADIYRGYDAGRDFTPPISGAASGTVVSPGSASGRAGVDSSGGRGKTSRFCETIAVRRYNGQDIGTVATIDEAKALAHQDAEYRPRERYGFKVSRLIRQGRVLKQGSCVRDYIYDPATYQLVVAQAIHPDRQPRRVKTAHQGEDDWAFLDADAPEGLRADEVHDTDGENLLQDPGDERFMSETDGFDLDDNFMADDVGLDLSSLSDSLFSEESPAAFAPDPSLHEPTADEAPTVVVIRQEPARSAFSSDRQVDSLLDRIKSHVSDREDLEDQVREIKDQVDELVDLAESRGFSVMSDDEIADELGMQASPMPAISPTPSPGTDQPLPVGPGASPVRQGLVPEQVNETNAPVLTQRGV